MKHILALLLCLVFTTGFAQSDSTELLGRDSLVSFSCNAYDAWFLADATKDNPAVLDALTWALNGVTDSAATVTIKDVTQSDIVDVTLSIRMLPEGVAAEINKRLLIKIQTQLLAYHPWLYYQLVGILEDNRRRTSDRVNSGKALIQKKITYSNRQG